MTKPLRILVLSDREIYGGAAMAAKRIADGLAGAGHGVAHVVSERSGPSSHAIRLVRKPRVPLGNRVMAHLSPAQGARLAKRDVRRELEKVIRQHRPDVISIHNLHFGISRHHWSLELVDLCASSAPTVWSLHDMWSFTGRCSYAYDCRRFLTGCTAACPTHQEYPALDPQEVPSAWRERKKLLERHPSLVAVASSRWLGDEARSGLWSRHRVEVIPTGVPVDAYRPVPVAAAREALGIDPKAKVFAVVAQTLTDHRKGGHLLIEALRLCPVRPIVLLCMGNDPVEMRLPGVQCVNLGFVQGGPLQSIAYSAADALLHPAIYDNLPNVIMEAMACGTPSVGFAIGGVPDMVRPGLTGWLAPEVSAKSMADAISQAASILPLEAGKLRDFCRATAEREYALEIPARRYSELFHGLVNREVASVPSPIQSPQRRDEAAA